MSLASLRSITLVRHGLTEWAANGQHTSITDVDLTEQGREQAKILWRYFAQGEHHFDGVYSSPLRRALHTAVLAGFSPSLHPKLQEWHYGRYEGKTSAEIHREDPEWTIFRCGAPEGETSAEVRRRCQELLAEWQEAGHERVLCFAHGHILRALACCWLGQDLTFGDHLHMDAGSISRLGWEHETPAIILWNQLLY